MTSFTKLAADYSLYFGDLGISPKEGVDKSHLEKLAKDVTRSYLMDATSLNTAIQKIANENQNLSNDHLRRIAEMSNNNVYDHLFKNSPDKNVHFDIADPDQFIGKQELVEKTASYDNSAYELPPTKKQITKIASQENNEDDVEYGFHANPRQDLYDLQEKLQATKEHFLTEKLANAFHMQSKYAELYKSVRKELPQAGFQKIAQVLNTVANTSSELDVLEDLTYDLMKQKIASFEDLNINTRKIQELGINMEHPLVQNFVEYTKLANQKEQIELALEEIELDLQKTASSIKNSRR